MTQSDATGSEAGRYALGGEMPREITDSNLLDLFEEMLFARAVKGIRPLLYLSSDKDFECSVLKLLDEPRESRVWEEHRFAMPGVGQRVTNCF